MIKLVLVPFRDADSMKEAVHQLIKQGLEIVDSYEANGGWAIWVQDE